MTVSMLDKDGSAAQQVNIDVTATKVNEFVSVTSSSAVLTLPEGDVVLSISAHANQTRVAATDSDLELASVSLVLEQVTIV